MEPDVYFVEGNKVFKHPYTRPTERILLAECRSEDLAFKMLYAIKAMAAFDVNAFMDGRLELIVQLTNKL